MQYIALAVLWNYLLDYNPLRVLDKLTRIASLVRRAHTFSFALRSAHPTLRQGSYGVIVFLHAAELAFASPARNPDPFPVLNLLLSAAVFAAAWELGTVRLLQVLGGPVVT